MPRIFINYRRDDSAGWVTAIYNELIKHYERDQLFRDIDTIDFGVDFVDAINDAVQQCACAIHRSPWNESHGYSHESNLKDARFSGILHLRLGRLKVGCASLIFAFKFA